MCCLSLCVCLLSLLSMINIVLYNSLSLSQLSCLRLCIMLMLP